MSIDGEQRRMLGERGFTLLEVLVVVMLMPGIVAFIGIAASRTSDTQPGIATKLPLPPRAF